MKLCAIFALASLFLAGCAASPANITTPIELIGTVSKPVWTGWYKDFCEAEKITPSTPSCLQVGGEIYRVVLLGARTPGGARIARKLIIGFPAHALPREYRDEKRVQLVNAPDDFRTATGIQYLVSEWDDI